VPTYQYACTEAACGHAFEQVQSFTDDALTVCPRCEGRLRKVFNAVGVVFKGSGFYRTDSRKDARGEGRSSSTSEGGSSSSDTGSASTSGEKAGAVGTSSPSSTSTSSSGTSGTSSATAGAGAA
jgi:putative FmdB family regulatory protein